MQNKPVYVQEKCTWGYLFFKLLKHNVHSFAKQLYRLGLYE